jgi:hypothetical protein
VATTGEVLFTAAASVSETPWSDNTWANPTEALTNNTTYASVTAGTYDATDQTWVLKLTGADLSVIPAGATIDGVTVRIEARADSTSVFLDLVQLLDTVAAKVGDNLALAPSLDVPLTTSDAVYTFGGAAVLWGNALTRAWVQDPEFGVGIGARADIANSQVFIDVATIEVNYTDASVLVTPGVASLISSTFAPTVTATQNQLVTPGLVSLTLASFAPTVSTPRVVTPDPAALTLTTFAPTVTGGSGTTVTPGLAELTFALFAPVVTTTDHQTVVPGPLGLTLTGFAPTVSATANVLVTPDTASLILTGFAPVVAGDAVSADVPAMGKAGLYRTLAVAAAITGLKKKLNKELNDWLEWWD